MKRRYKIAAIDFDGVIKPTEESNKYDPPLPECIETLHDLKAAGMFIALTAREKYPAICLTPKMSECTE